MIKYSEQSFTDKIKSRIRVLWGISALMLVYMVVVGEMGLGDSRIMTTLAENISRVIFFGGLATVIYRIVYNKKLLKNRSMLLERQKEEADERQKFLHDKSGGIVVDILLLILLFVTCTAALSDMVAFYLSFSILVTTIILKAGSYLFYSKKY